MPVKLAEMRGNSWAENRLAMLPQEGTTWDQDALLASKLGCAWHYFNSSPGAYQVSLSPLSPAKQMVKGFQRPARLIGVDKFVVGTLISQRRCSSSCCLSGKHCWAGNSAWGRAVCERVACERVVRERVVCVWQSCVWQSCVWKSCVLKSFVLKSCGERVVCDKGTAVEAGGRRECTAKNKNPTQRCGEYII